MHSVPVNTIMKVTTYRQLSLAVKVASEGPIRSITLFGSFRLVFDSRKHRYSVQRLVQVSLIKSQWVPTSAVLRHNARSLPGFFTQISHYGRLWCAVFDKTNWEQCIDAERANRIARRLLKCGNHE